MKYIEELRRRSGHSQKEWGALIGVSQAAISYYENGIKRPSCKQYGKYKKFLKKKGVEFDDEKLYTEFGVSFP